VVQQTHKSNKLTKATKNKIKMGQECKTPRQPLVTLGLEMKWVSAATAEFTSSDLR